MLLLITTAIRHHKVNCNIQCICMRTRALRLPLHHLAHQFLSLLDKIILTQSNIIHKMHNIDGIRWPRVIRQGILETSFQPVKIIRCPNKHCICGSHLYRTGHWILCLHSRRKKHRWNRAVLITPTRHRPIISVHPCSMRGNHQQISSHIQRRICQCLCNTPRRLVHLQFQTFYFRFNPIHLQRWNITFFHHSMCLMNRTRHEFFGKCLLIPHGRPLQCSCRTPHSCRRCPWITYNMNKMNHITLSRNIPGKPPQRFLRVHCPIHSKHNPPPLLLHLLLHSTHGHLCIRIDSHCTATAIHPILLLRKHPHPVLRPRY
mmetsp:Transcript_1244/g.2541  ORF Transcript_1244/g.2541 Transcript_1244/m.2541 type:complete len:317 (+) Transcript_1244:328-1278(+)